MEKNIDKMIPPWFQTKQIVFHHINNMHQGAVNIGRCAAIKGPDRGGKDIRDIFEICDPFISQYLEFVVVDKSVLKSRNIKPSGK